jgi:hypothetical protein
MNENIENLRISSGTEELRLCLWSGFLLASDKLSHLENLRAMS